MQHVIIPFEMVKLIISKQPWEKQSTSLIHFNVLTQNAFVSTCVNDSYKTI